jgi:hypothetical protein
VWTKLAARTGEAKNTSCLGVPPVMKMMQPSDASTRLQAVLNVKRDISVARKVKLKMSMPKSYGIKKP